ncbi:MAG: GTPase ObgE [Candidatus Omnitrophica bacterium]|nr:GTPase ObgE [Candidatus Omnitrophota bacterium]
MIFVDEARIFVKAGDGGNGCESHYRDKRMRHPRPDGGDGGNGGNIVLLADKRIHTLLDFRYKQHYKADKGGHGSSKGKNGRTGKDCVLRVPVGTLVRDNETRLLIKDLTKDQQTVIVAKGGAGGIGNARRKFTVPPHKGEERVLALELKLIADVGFIGFPNAGKSTLISSISKVKSKIANYPFTTKQPILGFVQADDFDFVVADLPGIIEGAHKGKGLGDRFLKHAERTKILVHVIDMAGTECRDPLDDYAKILHEIEAYGERLSVKHRIVAANKMDLAGAAENLDRFRKRYPGEILPISAASREGVDDLVDELVKALCSESSPEK